jgi:hypothetical protein
MKEEDLEKAFELKTNKEKLKLFYSEIESANEDDVTLHISFKSSYTNVNPFIFTKSNLLAFIENELNSKDSALTEKGVTLAQAIIKDA